MPTPAERRALFFVSALMVLGGTVRAYAALAGPNGAPSTQERQALDQQIRSVDSAKQKETARKKAKTAKRPRKGTVEHAVPPGTGVSQSGPNPAPTNVFLRVPRKRKTKSTDPSENAARTHAPLDVDLASAADIQRLPRIGPVLARRIVADRDSLGPFGSLDGLTRVRGIGPALARILKPYVTFSLEPRPPRVADPGGRGTTRKPRRGRSRVSDPP